MEDADVEMIEQEDDNAATVAEAGAITVHSTHPTQQLPLHPHTASAPSHTAPVTPALDMNHMVVFCADKAGMSNSSSVVSKSTINQVIFDMSVGSAHFKNAQVKTEKVGERIEKMKRTVASARAKPPHLIQAARARITRKIHDLESTRPLARNWVVVDMDAFFAQVEIRDRPELATKPVAVGGMSMISASNYVARQYGVRSAMPGFIALKLCPHLVFVESNFDKYREVAEQTREIFREYDPQFEAGSLDEAYMDITDYVRREARRRRRLSDPIWQARKKMRNGDGLAVNVEHASADDAVDEEEDDSEPLPTDAQLTPAEIVSNGELAFEIANEIRRRIFEKTKLTCSAGIGCNRMVAKIATDMNKPNGQHLVPHTAQAVLEFMSSLSVRKIPGIGKVMERILQAMDIHTCAHLREPDQAILCYEVFSVDTANWLLSVSLGLASTEHHSEEDSKRKSISTERTFREISSWVELELKLQEVATMLAKDIQSARCLGGKNITLKLKTTAFEVFTRSVTVEKYISSKEDLIKYGTQLLKEECDRLLAVQAKQFKQAASAPSHSTPAAAVATAVVHASPHKGAPSATQAVSPSTSTQSAKPLPTVLHSTHARDGVLKLRLMGMRLSTLKDEPHEPKDKRNKSILCFVTTGSAPVANSSAPSASTATTTFHPISTTPTPSPIIKRERASPTDADITSFFLGHVDSVKPIETAFASSTQSSKPKSNAPIAGTAVPTLDRFFAKSLEASFAHASPSNVHPSSQHPTSAASADRPSFSAAPSIPDVSTFGSSRTRTDTSDIDHAAATVEMLDDPDAKEEDEAWFQEFMSQPEKEDEETDGLTVMDTEMTDATPTSVASSSSSIPSAMSVPSPSPPVPSSVVASSSSSSSSSLACPVCGRVLGSDVGNLELNRHIDACLAGGGKTHQQKPSGKGGANKRKTPSSHQPEKGVQTLDKILFKPKMASSSGSARPNTPANPINLD